MVVRRRTRPPILPETPATKGTKTTTIIQTVMTDIKIFAETERLILREIVHEDEDAFFELDSDPEVHRYLGNNPVKNIQETRDIIKAIRKQYIDNGIGRWAMIEKNTDRFIGWTGLKLVRENINGHINFYDLGFRLIRKYWGKGYATESAIASLSYGFDKLNLLEIYGMADHENAGSIHVLTKAGLTYIETFYHVGIKHYCYKIDRNEWMERDLTV